MLQSLESPLNSSSSSPTPSWRRRSARSVGASPPAAAPWCSRAGAERVLGLTIKGGLLTAQKVLDLLVLWRITMKCGQLQYLKEHDWWLLALGTFLSTVLSAVTLSRHRCALRQNRPYGCFWASLAAVFQLTALVEMVDKLGDGLCWGILECFPCGSMVTPVSSHQARLPEMKGSRYGENLMRGLRKLSIAGLPMILLSTSVHLVRQWQVLLNVGSCDRSICQAEMFALCVGIVCLANACSDVVLYIWVEDVYVRRHKKLVQFHYLIELLAREPLLLLFHAVLEPEHGPRPLIFLWAADMLANMTLLLLPTLKGWIRGRLSCRHGLSQVTTALIVAQLLFGVNVTYFDPRDAFIVLNAGYYIVKMVEMIAMLKILSPYIGDMNFFQPVFQAQLAVAVANAALVWVVVPWSHRSMDTEILRSVEALPRLRSLLPGSSASDSSVGIAAVRRGRSSSVFSQLGAELPVLDRSMSLELGTVGAPLAAVRKLHTNQLGEDSAARLELLGDILEALCLLSQTQSGRNRPVLCRTMVVNILWSLVLPCQGEYDDGKGGTVVLTMLDPERGVVLLQHRPGREQPSGQVRPASWSDEESEVIESIGLVFHGTAIEVMWEGEGRVFGIFDDDQIRFTDKLQTVWTRRPCQGGGPDPAALASAGHEVLKLVLTQLLLALRWEPTFCGIGPTGAPAADRSIAAIDASQRPLLAFLVRHAIAKRDLILISEVYWSLWCLSRDPQDNDGGAYEKARWVLVTALQGGIEFWDGDRMLRLDNPAGIAAGTSGPGNEACDAFRRQALQLLASHGSIWRQTVLLAQLAIDVQGDALERTRAVRERLLATRARVSHSQAESEPIELLQEAEDPYLIDIRSSLEERTRTGLTDPGTERFVSLPVDPGARFLGVDIGGCEILQSNSWPLVLACVMEAEATPAQATSSSQARGSEDSTSPSTCVQKCMVKLGDDLRQDQLVLQLLVIMERVWRERLPAREHQMLRLAPYRVLAMTPYAGYVKFVPGAVSLSKALYRSRGDLRSWLEAARPSNMTLAEVLDNLCGSVAAYCVATYCLGIGDRHLDNLQITPQGYFFHIDFGFIFGDDPKPFAPRLRLPQPVASALHATEAGGDGASGETLLDRCFLLAGRAYIALRRSMPLWVSLLRVTGEAGGAGCPRLRANADAAVVMVRDRLRADLGPNDEDHAVADFLLVLHESTEALYPVLTDKVHQLGLFWK